jgi:phage shock protein A
MEDPEKIIEQSVIDMQNDLQRTRQSYAEVYALLKKLEKQRDDSLKVSQEYFRKAELAMKLGNEHLARDALSARLRHISLSEKFGNQIHQQKVTVERLHSAMAILEERISQAKLQKDEYIVRAKAAKSRIEVSQLLSTVSSATSVDAFEKMKDKVESLEVQANLNDDLNESPTNTDKKLQVMEQNEAVEKELQSLRDSFIVNRAIFPNAKPTQTSISTRGNLPL